MEAKVRNIFNDPAIGLIGINAFHDKLIEYGIKIELDDLARILSKEESYIINRPTKTKFVMRKVIVYYVYEQLQADLVFMDTKQSGPASQNDNYKYLLTVIDVLSK